MKPPHFIALIATLVLLGNTGAMATNITDPVLTVSGTNTSQQTVSVTVTDSAGPIYYTTDGTNPTASSNAITTGSTLLIAQNAVLKVQAIQSSTTTSNLVTAQYATAAQVSAGTSHTLAIRNDGTVWAWGDNSVGELGNGSLIAATQPTEVMINATTPLSNIVSVAAGTDQSFAVDNQGNVWAWGLNANGQLGNGGTANFVNPAEITGLQGAVSVASSGSHTLALLGNGAVYAWGNNASGQIGNGSTGTWVTTPTEVLAPNSQSGTYIRNIVAVAAGTNHSLALESTGKVYSWGDNSYGQLGDGDSTLALQSKPVYVKTNGNPFTNAVGVTADSTNSFALQGNGTSWAWGDNSIGELGNGSITPSGVTNPANLSPSQVTGLSGVLTIGNQSALISSSTIWSWGDDTAGRLGVGIASGYADMPLNVSLTTGVLPTISITTGNGQSVTDGTLSPAFTITVTSFDSPAANTWVNFAVPSSEGALATSPTGSLLSPIIGEETNSQGIASVYLDGASSASGPVQLIATSGATQTTFSALASTAIASTASGEPTMPEWMLIFMAAGLVYFATRQRAKPIA